MRPLIGVSRASEKIRAQIKQAAEQESTVVISGEQGVGKDNVAQNLYHSSCKKDAAFIKVKVSAASDDLIKEVFYSLKTHNHTSIEKQAIVSIENTPDTVLFMEEIECLSHQCQAEMLQMLQDRERSQKGSQQKEKSSLWIIAATGENLAGIVRYGGFNEDLYHLLCITNIHVPPLRERPEDIPVLIDYFIQQYTPQFNNRQVLKPGKSDMKKLMIHQWPGNVNQLQEVLREFLIIGDWRNITRDL